MQDAIELMVAALVPSGPAYDKVRDDHRTKLTEALSAVMGNEQVCLATAQEMAGNHGRQVVNGVDLEVLARAEDVEAKAAEVVDQAATTFLIGTGTMRLVPGRLIDELDDLLNPEE